MSSVTASGSEDSHHLRVLGNKKNTRCRTPGKDQITSMAARIGHHRKSQLPRRKMFDPADSADRLAGDEAFESRESSSRSELRQQCLASADLRIMTLLPRNFGILRRSRARQLRARQAPAVAQTLPACQLSQSYLAQQAHTCSPHEGEERRSSERQGSDIRFRCEMFVPTRCKGARPAQPMRRLVGLAITLAFFPLPHRIVEAAH